MMTRTTWISKLSVEAARAPCGPVDDRRGPP